MRIAKKSVSLLIVIMLLMATFMSVPTATQASSYPTTHPNTHINTGNGAVDITEVAKTQVGYQENSVGTKYGYWYNTSFVKQPWCAMFVSWCAEQAGISQDVILKFASCSAGVRWFKEQNIWHDSAYYGGNYTPKKGDIIFYRNNGSANLSDHVGIVLGVNGNYIHVIEGNATNESCCEFTTNSSRTLSNKFVIGYASPDYSGSSENTTVEEPTTYENWQITTADVLSLRESYTTDSKRLTTMPRGSILKVTEFSVQSDYLWGYTNIDGKKGWCALDYCEYINGNIDGVYYQMPPAFKLESTTVYIQQKLKLESENTLTATYKSSDKSVAKVNKNGKITGIASGKAEITCTTPTGSDTCTVTVNKPKLEKSSYTIYTLDTCQIKIAGAYESYAYVSANPEIASVDEKGVVTGVSAGETTITATSESGIQLSCTVKVNKEPETYQRFTVDENNVYLKDAYQGNDIVLIPKNTLISVTEVKYSDTYTWGKTSYSGKDGWVILNDCKYVDGKINGKVYKVKAYLEEAVKELYVGDTYTVTLMSYSGKVSYLSKKPEIATVDENGVVTALKAGNTNIVVQAGNTKLKCKIKVKNPSLNKTELNVIKGEKIQLKVVGGSGDIVWTTDNKKVAKINKKGVVTGKGYGTALITATRNGITMQCVVNAYDPVVTPSVVTLSKKETMFLSVSQNLSSEIKWETSDEKIVKVNQKGKIKGKKKGTALITATVDGKKLTTTVTVK